MSTPYSSVFRPKDGEDVHPHACADGLVFLTYTAYDPEVGAEVVRIEVVPCSRCAEGRATTVSSTGTTIRTPSDRAFSVR
jgi:hypothetical protein